jgi:phenylpyruvate tautomerase PptA (4-oxalocrotonate tautomerase family)
MPLAKIHVVEGRYDETRIAKVSGAIQAALMNTLRVPPEDFYQLIFEFPKKRFLHTPSFVGMHYTDDLLSSISLSSKGDRRRRGWHF